MLNVLINCNAIILLLPCLAYAKAVLKCERTSLGSIVSLRRHSSKTTYINEVPINATNKLHVHVSPHKLIKSKA